MQFINWVEKQIECFWLKICCLAFWEALLSPPWLAAPLSKVRAAAPMIQMFSWQPACQGDLRGQRTTVLVPGDAELES